MKVGVSTVIDRERGMKTECVIQSYARIIDHDKVAIPIRILAGTEVLRVAIVRFICSRCSVNPTGFRILNL
jgi:hypothetical protein